jgi:uncharacterized protein (DUF924 family)
MQRTVPTEILHVWFTELTPQQHFVKDAALDESIRTRFGPTLEAAARCELFPWRATPEGRLAEILVLDQFSRNVYRDTARAFAQDPLALALAQELVASGQDRSLPTAQRVFAYMPYMHSESALIHEQALTLFAQQGMENNLDLSAVTRPSLTALGVTRTATRCWAAPPRPKSWLS